MQLHPRENFTITRQLQDPSLTSTFYVQAVIRNAKTDTILETINLTDKTGQRFTGLWKVPADASGQGFWISIITSVYTDSGYTTKSTDYGDEENTYLVQERYIFNPNYQHSGQDIDYSKIRKIVKEVIDENIDAEGKDDSTESEDSTKKLNSEISSFILEIKNILSENNTNISNKILGSNNINKESLSSISKMITSSNNSIENKIKSLLYSVQSTNDELKSSMSSVRTSLLEIRLSIDSIRSTPSDVNIESKIESKMDPRINRLKKLK